MSFLSGLGCALLLQVAGPIPTLVPGQSIEDQLGVETVIEIESLHRAYPGAIYQGKSFRLRVPTSGPYTIEVRSYLFDPYVDLIDARGMILAADDQSSSGPRARLVVELDAGQECVVRVCGARDQPGAFTVEVRSGHPAAMTDVEARLFTVAECRREVEVREQAFGTTHERVAGALNDLGPVLVAQAQYQEARTVLERALRIDEQRLGADHADTACVQSNLSIVLFYLGQYEDALVRAQQALSVTQGEHPETATRLHNVGFLLTFLQRLPEARQHLERALVLRSKLQGEDDPETISTRSYLGRVLRDLGEPDAARSVLAMAREHAEHLVGPARDEAMFVLLPTLSLVEEDLGFLERSLELQSEGLAIAERKYGPRHPETAGQRLRVATLQRRLGHLESARTGAEQCVDDYTAAMGSDNSYVAWALEVEADVLDDAGESRAAAELYERVAQLREKTLGPRHPHTAIALNNLGYALNTVGEKQRGRQLQERAFEILSETRGAAHVDTLQALLNLKSDLASAELEPVLRTCEQALGPAHEVTLQAAASLGRASMLTGDDARARELCTRAYNGLRLSSWIRRRSPLTNLVVVETETGNLESGWQRAHELVAGDLRHMQSQLWLAGEQQRFRYAAQFEDDLDLLLSCAARLGEARADETYQTFASWKGVVFRSMCHTIDQLKGAMSAAQLEQIGRLRGGQERLSRLAYASGVTDATAHAAALQAQQDELARLEAALAQSLQLAPEAHRVVPAALAAALPAHSAFVDFFVHRPRRFRTVRDGLVEGTYSREPEHLLAWVLTPGAPHVRMLDLGDAQAARDAVTSFVDALVAERGLRPADRPRPSANDRLRSVLWAPLQALLADAELLFVAPDRFLGRLPLEALQLDDGRFVVERVVCVYVQDATMLADLLRTRRPRREAPSLLALGGVDYDATETAIAQSAKTAGWRDGFVHDWLPLPQTRAEAEGAVHYHEKVFGARAERRLLTGAAASEDTFRGCVSRATVVHLATHGFFEPAGLPSLWEAARADAADATAVLEPHRAGLSGYPPGLLSGLVLAGANARGGAVGGDGLLTAAETAWLPLDSCDLVVLSACETGLGQARPGEGMLSLRRAFQQAGARTVISSLWRVRDDSTARLMLDFYRRLWEGRESAAAALRGAQLALLAENRRRHQHALPATWGAFVLAGDWR